ncbi:MAG: thioredoxin family protein [Fimbriimonadaceae bacterium]|nr:thioredoxin family protein [Fimbriimonadaceae bacterium]
MTYGLKLRIAISHASIHSVLAVLLVSVLQASPAVAQEIAWRTDVDEAMSESAREDKPMLVMVSASWCGYCRKMLRQTFPDPAVSTRVNSQFNPVLIDADREQALVRS